MRTMTNPTSPRTSDGNLIASKLFADVFQAYLECSDQIQAEIRELVHVVNAEDASEDEREAALATIAEALFPTKHNGALGMDLEECEKQAKKDIREVIRNMGQEEQSFSDRLGKLLEAKGISQSQLASEIGIGQPAISMMLSRKCRPQRRTIEKIAKVLKVSAEEIWPDFKDK